MKKNTKTAPSQLCPCGSGKTYDACCKRWHEGDNHLQAPDAESLMCSRYTAYVFKLSAYLLDTWHPQTRPETLEDDESSPKWLGLTIHNHQQQDGTHATVEFTARYSINGKAHRMHESSTFEKLNGCWYYRDGVAS
ncbi:MAG: YchJ family protein [Saezia sp.]